MGCLKIKKEEENLSEQRKINTNEINTAQQYGALSWWGGGQRMCRYRDCKLYIMGCLEIKQEVEQWKNTNWLAVSFLCSHWPPNLITRQWPHISTKTFSNKIHVYVIAFLY